MLVALVVWVVLMVFWLIYAFGIDTPVPGKPYRAVGTLIPWACVLILGLILFGAIKAGPIAL